jgi:hypothetical protein
MARSASGHDDGSGQGSGAPRQRSRRAMLAGGAAGAFGVLALDGLGNALPAQAANGDPALRDSAKRAATAQSVDNLPAEDASITVRRPRPYRRHAQAVQRLGGGERLAGQRFRALPDRLRVDDRRPGQPSRRRADDPDPARPGRYRRTDRRLGHRLQLGLHARYRQQRAHADHHRHRHSRL